ncbi:MAG: nitrogenase component 1 [Elusimicrobiales bacterium]|nr:nitrogenase component 1 [Elusimicrobiales bacterium]
MNATSRAERFTKSFNMPYQLGVYLAVNAVNDVGLVVDGGDCVMPKADFIAGNHDLRSTLLSPEGSHRIVCTMTGPLPQDANHERKLSALLSEVASGGGFSAVLLTGLPFFKLAGADYEGIAAGVRKGAPVAEVPALSLEADWLDGYDLALESLAGLLPAPRSGRKRAAKRPRVALAGYLFDRGERDHTANIAELRRLLDLAGLELISVFPSGGSFRELARSLEADLIVSLPYARRSAARLAARSGAALLETGLPMGLKGTSSWLAAVRRAAGLGRKLPPPVLREECLAARELAPVLDVLAHRNAVFAGDPHLFAAFAGLAAEFRIRVPAVVLDSRARKKIPVKSGGTVLVCPDTAEAAGAVAALTGYGKPHLLVGNSFAATEGFAPGLPFVELGFPSYGHHCVNDEPFLGFAGARTFAGRMVNALRGGNRRD